MNLKNTIKNIIFPFLKKLSDIYLAKERKYRYKGITVKIKPSVFHPGFFISTKLLQSYLEKLDLSGKSFLEPGAGSGFLSIYAAKNKAIVTSTDISKTAVQNISENAALNNVEINVIESDLFKNIPNRKFDFIVINPPYFPQKPETEKEYAWYCGNNFKYFHNLFNQLPGYMSSESNVIMILADVCDIVKIKEIAAENSFQLKEVFRKIVLWEANFIFRITR